MDDGSVDLAGMTPRAQQRWCDAYTLGYEHGIAAGRRQVEDEDAARWAALRHYVHRVAAVPSFADAADRRGDHDRAAANRALLRQRGIGA